MLVESGGDNLTATFSYGLVDKQIFVVDVAGGDKVPRKGGPGVIRSDLLVINKTDLAPLVGADLEVMRTDAERLREDRPTMLVSLREQPDAGPIVEWVTRAVRVAVVTAGAREERDPGGDAADRRACRRSAGLRWMHGWPVVLRPTGPGRRAACTWSTPRAAARRRRPRTVRRRRPGARLAVHSAGATLVQPGAATDAPARWTVELQVGAGARVHWAPEPTVVSDGAALESTVRVVLAAVRPATVREIVVLGRHGQRGGRYAGTTARRRRGVPLLAHTTLLDGADPSSAGRRVPAGPGRSGRSCARGGVGTLPGGEPDVRWAWSALDGPGEVLMAVGTPRGGGRDAEGRAAGAEDRSRGRSRPAGLLVPARRPVAG